MASEGTPSFEPAALAEWEMERGEEGLSSRQRWRIGGGRFKIGHEKVGGGAVTTTVGIGMPP